MKYADLDSCYRCDPQSLVPLVQCRASTVNGRCPNAATVNGITCDEHAPAEIIKFRRAMAAFRLTRTVLHADCKWSDEPRG